jgi:hypothetical protein
VDLTARVPEDEVEEKTQEIMDRFEKIGTDIMNRANGDDTVGYVLRDRDKRRSASILLGQAYVTAHNFIEFNKEKVEQIAEVLVERREMHGDEVVDLLDSVELSKPEIDLLDETVWPKL